MSELSADRPSENKPTVSLCMIVRDEERYLGQALKSFKPLTDEIIVIDTGSKDHTVEIAKSYGAQIFHFAWIDDFSAARNFSLSKASGKWILTLDADEAIAERDYSKFRDLTDDLDSCWVFTERHYTDDPLVSDYRLVKGQYPEWELGYDGYFTTHRVRLFPNDPEIRFTGAIHELVEHNVRAQAKYQIKKSDIPIHHYGHTSKVKGAKDQRNGHLYAELGRKKIARDPTHWQSYFELGLEYSNRKIYEQSLSNFEKAAELNPGFFEIHSRMGYVLSELGRYPEAIQALELALSINPKDHESYGNLGVVLMRMKKYSLAVDALTHATQMFPEFVRGYYNLANALLRMGNVHEAVTTYDWTLRLCPGYTTAKVELGTILLFLKRLDRAETLLVSALKDDPEDTAALYSLGHLYHSQNRPCEALKLFECFLRLSGNTNLNLQVERSCQTLRQQGA